MKIIIPKEVHDKIMHFVNKADFEVSGFGKVEWDADQQAFRVLDACLLKQEGGMAHTDIDPTALSRAMYLLRNTPGHLNYWWHSHVDMPVFWSGTDMDTIRTLGRNGFIVASVFNKKDEVRSAFCCKVEVPMIGSNDHLVDEIEMEIEYDEDVALIASWNKEFDDNVVRKQYTMPDYNRQWDRPGYAGSEALTAHQQTLLPGTREFNYENERPDHVSLLDWESLCEEARMIGMDPVEYEETLRRGNDKQIKRLQKRLDKVFDTDFPGVPRGNRA